MQELLERQSAIINEIERIYINYKKDSMERKTPEYLLKRLEAIDNLWGEFEQNHKILEASADKSSDYFKKDIYSDVISYYNKARAAMKADTEKSATPKIGQPSTSKGKFTTSLQAPVINIETDSPRNDIQGLLVQQYANFRALERQTTRINDRNIEEKWEIEDELRNLQQRWRNIDDLHLQIDAISAGTEKHYEEKFAAVENNYIIIKRNLNQKLCSSAHLQQSLPQIDIPLFTGKYTQWPTFCDLYTEAIHSNKYLTNTQKMQHLKCKVKGEAERIIQHLHISAENYETAWEILNHRYNNPQLLFTNQVEILLNQSNIYKQSSYELKKLYDTTTECIHAIHNLGVDTNSWDPLLVHILSKKLDIDTYSDYKGSRKEPRSLPTLEELMSFIERKFTALEPIQRREKENQNINKSVYQAPKSSSNHRIAPSPQYQNKSYGRGFYQAATTYTRKPCVVCNAFHDLFMCTTFQNMSTREQIETLSKHNICPNCLYKHFGKPCNSTRRCKECDGPHNTKIHDAFQQSKLHSTSNKQQATQNVQAQSPASSTLPSAVSDPHPIKQIKQHNANYVATNDEEILLTTISIKAQSADGTYIILRALLDQGSQVTLISENAAQLLGLQRQRYHASVSGIGPSSKPSKGMVTLVCESIYEDYQFTTQALVISRVIDNLPNTSFKSKSWPHIQHLNLADPEYNISKPIDLLLDASVYSDIIMEGLIRGPPDAPIAQHTRLGWILSGNVKTFRCNVVINHIEDLSKYWEIEDIHESRGNSPLSDQEQYCEDLYTSTTRRLEDGRYEVAIPMKQNFEQKLGHSKSIALARFSHMERKMSKNQILSDAYKQFMQEYESLGHMREVNNATSMNETACYLPHHGVVKLDATTTKLRVVFNASAKTSSGYSLNELMESGPNLQQDLQGLILKWREYKYVMTADIEKMFRQIMIRPTDQPLQSIIWRNSPRDLIKQYHLTTVTYGTKAAPFLAMRTLRQIASDNKEYQLAAQALNNSFYMDDVMCGTDTIIEAKKLQKDLIEVLQNAGMNLRKWSSNASELTEDLSAEKLNTIFEFKDAENRKTLGLRWNPASDTFSYQCKLTEGNQDHTITKRQLLSEVSKIYDPLGWLSPLTIRGKILFQQTWLSNLSWDDALPESIQNEWKELKKDLLKIEIFQIPRYLGHSGHSLQIHGFCDASEKAYACAIYLVAQNNKGECTSRLITAKTKVVPTKKQISLPRLELLGALLLSQLMKKTLDSMFSSQKISIHAWTDSMIVLGWLYGDISKWKQFVANRIKQIINIIPTSCWHHVKSENNSADCATRGINSSNLSNHSLWWNGPTFIIKDQQKVELDTYQEPSIEVKKIHSVHTALQANPNSTIYKLLNEMSSITRITKTIAWVLRFISRARKSDYAAKTLSPSEQQNALNIIIKTVQNNEFYEEILSLKKNHTLKANSRILNLNPYLDENGILRVGGRLENTILHYSAKHPIILSTSSRLTELIIDQAHLTTLHGGPKLTLSYIRDTYWIVSGVRTVKKQLRNCIKCRRFSQTNKNQIMANLPTCRVKPARPFSNVGVDFTGYVDLKLNKGRGVRTCKGYIAVFVCMATKAVHLELVSDLSTDAFLAAFRRMCSRRGTPKNMYSDNGTNFVGAAKFLKKEYKEIIRTINHDVIVNNSEMGVSWHFNAPSWPSAGGLWEAAVKSLKHHLKRVMGEQKLTYEELTTLLHQVEACMNSRPLCALTENPDDSCLTPGHFLVGGPILARPQTDPDIIPLSSRWQLVQAMNKQIWKSWSREYLQNLQTRSKWKTPTRNIKLNDIVIIKEENMPPGKWALARVCELHPGKDGHTRVVTLKTQNNTMKRPVSKLILLPVQEEEKQSK